MAKTDVQPSTDYIMSLSEALLIGNAHRHYETENRSKIAADNAERAAKLHGEKGKGDHFGSRPWQGARS